ncbi:MAG: TlyA family RNA methyltransferase [Desulfofustis sp.]|nr:TlyA family RNA methyltransferase [Desulfofustis sp.]
MTRLDQLLVECGEAASLKEASALVMTGTVLVDDRVVDKPGTLVSTSSIIRIKRRLAYVSRGGLKLEAALSRFNISPSDWVCADIGAAAGGFTDCLLQAGARRVYAIDVAYGMLDWKLRTDPRVVVIERCNVRQLSDEHIDRPLDLAVFDTSFISLTKVIPPVIPFFRDRSIRIVALVKPQFECAKEYVARGGVVENEHHRLEAVEQVCSFCAGLGLVDRGFMESPITGAKGNREYLIYLVGRP